MTPEELAEKMFEESPCCTLSNCRKLLCTVIKAIWDGEVVDVGYSIGVIEDTAPTVVLKPDFEKFLKGE